MENKYFENTIKKYLDKRAETDSLFAKQYLKADKSIDKCCAYIITEVKKSGRSGFCDDEIYGLAVHYYTEDNLQVSKAPACKVVVNLSDQTKERLEEEAEAQYRQIKLQELKDKEIKANKRKKQKAESLKKKNEEVGQLSLF